MGRYRKKPVEIEARRVPIYDEATSVTDYVDECIDLAEWCNGRSDMMHSPGDEGHDHIAIPTLEGTMEALPGDWIIRGVQGELYPCKPDVFDATYDPVGANEGTVTGRQEVRVRVSRPGSKSEGHVFGGVVVLHGDLTADRLALADTLRLAGTYVEEGRADDLLGMQ